MPRNDGGQRPRRMFLLGARREQLIIHEQTYHDFYLRSPLEEDDNTIQEWLNSFADMLFINGLTRYPGSNYFYNGVCGVYILDREQIIIYRDGEGEPVGISLFATQSPSVYLLIGFLVFHNLIPTRLNNRAIPLDKPTTGPDQYEF
jgi:hypothetical protein